MSKITIVCVTALLLVVSAGASARGYGYGHHGGHHYGHHGGHAGFFFGGLLLGTVLARPHYVPSPHVVYLPPPTYVTPRASYAPQSQASVSRRLLRDIKGNCFERKLDGHGSELRIALPAADCAW